MVSTADNPAVPATMPFVKLVTDDPEKLLSFYTEVFGFKVIQRVESSAGTEWELEEIITHAADDQGCTLVLLKFLARAIPAPGGVVLGMRVPDIDAALERALDAGAVVARPLATETEHGVKVVFVEDPGGDGGFTYWPDGPDRPPRRFKAPFDNTCILSDNSKMYHRRESNGPVHQRDYPDLRLESLLHREDTGDWVIRNGDQEIARYGDQDMRTLFHYTALVFDELPDVRKYLDHTDDLTHEKVFEILTHDLKRRGIEFAEPADPMTDPDFIALLNKTYEMAPKEYPKEAPLAVRGAA
jgi:predicted enzyme related to lactoylglutathione lyase